MNLKEGMYVRTDKGIYKIEDISTDGKKVFATAEYKNRTIYTSIRKEKILDAKDRRTDLICVGDYVNGEYVDLFDLDYYKNHPEHIKSILIKEQFEKYVQKVG